MTLMLLLGLIAWLVPTAAGIWYLLSFREMRDEIKLIRRYVQAWYERAEQERR